MVVNASGDLELYAIHDTPKQAPWSARGDLAIGAGQSYTIISGLNENDAPEPWDVAPTTPMQGYPPQSVAQSEQTRDGSVIRGRVKHAGSFGRGDDDGFPTLGSGRGPGGLAANLAATRPGKGRTYSPASFRNYNYEPSAERSRSATGGGNGADTPRFGAVDQLAGEGSRPRSRRSTVRHKSSSRGRKGRSEVVHQVIEDDISMVMRSRAVRGYGLSNVGLSIYFNCIMSKC